MEGFFCQVGGIESPFLTALGGELSEVVQQVFVVLEYELISGHQRSSTSFWGLGEPYSLMIQRILYLASGSLLTREMSAT